MSRAVPRFRRNNPSLPAVGTGNVVVYKIVGTIEGQLTINTFMYQGAVPSPTQAQLTTLLTNISIGMFAKYVACISIDWTCTLESLDVVSATIFNGVKTTANAGLGGSRAAGHEPTEVAAVLIRRTAVKGQHGRGRVSLPAIATADVSLSRISAGAITVALNALGTEMLVSFSDGTNTWNPCVGQRMLASPRLVIGASPLTAVTVDSLLGTVRRRKIGRGK